MPSNYQAQKVRTSELEQIYLGKVSFDQARRVQEERVEGLRSLAGAEALIFCEHPNTFSFGKRSWNLAKSYQGHAKKLDAKLRCVSRGGLVTFHCPGQFVVYPVVSLRMRGWGVKFFIERLLVGIEQSLREAFPLEAGGRKLFTSMEEPGVWIADIGSELPARKLVSVGLEIRGGVTNHGFSINLDCDLRPNFFFNPCGFSSDRISSVEKELYLKGLNFKDLENYGCFERTLSNRVREILN